MKRSEKRLLIMLMGLALLGAGVIGSDVYFDKRDLLKSDQLRLENEWIEIQALLEDKDMWEMRATWLDKNQPAFTSDEAITQSIFDKAEISGVSGVTTSKVTLTPIQRKPDTVEVGVSFHAEGELGRLFRWLYDLTPPTAFRVIRNIKIIPNDEDPEQLTATIEMLRWYAPPGS